MNLSELIDALMRFDALTAREWVSDARRTGLVWTTVPRPQGLSVEELAVAAGVAELLAARAGQSPPLWTSQVSESPRPIYLVKAALSMPRLRKLCELEGPEPLRRRQVLAPPEFLSVA